MEITNETLYIFSTGTGGRRTVKAKTLKDACDILELHPYKIHERGRGRNKTYTVEHIASVRGHNSVYHIESINQ